MFTHFSLPAPAALLASVLAFTAVQDAAGQADLKRVRVSVKRVLDSNGSHHTLFSDATIRNRVRVANYSLGRDLGIQLVLAEVVDLPDPAPYGGVTSWFVVDPDLAGDMEDHAQRNPAAYGWRSDAINIYLVDSLTNGGGGRCSFPWNEDHREIIFIMPTIMNLGHGWSHEVGHYFGLLHTHETAEGVELYEPPDEVSSNAESSGDRVTDTPADPGPSSGANELAGIDARWGSGSVFGAESAPWRRLRWNIMSYYQFPQEKWEEPAGLFTHCQSIRARQCLESDRQHVVLPSASTHYEELTTGGSGSYGPGPVNTPWLQVSPPKAGQTLHAQVRNAAPSSSVGFAFMGTGAATSLSGPFSPGSLFWTQTDDGGRASASCEVPNDPALQGAEIRLMAYCYDSLAPSGVTWTSIVRGHLFHEVGSDFNGDGYEDVALGVPLEDVGARTDAGAVNIVYGGPSGVGTGSVSAQQWHQDSSGIYGVCESYDAFGSAVAYGDFNNDGYADLAIGAPGEGIGAASSTGGVHVLYGSPSGLRSYSSQFWSQNSAGISQMYDESGDGFGSALAAGDINGDGFADLAIGAWREDVGSKVDAGAVVVLYGSYAGLRSAGNQTFHGDTAGLNGSAESYDYFGCALALDDFDHDGYADLVIGAKGEDAYSIVNAGQVMVLPGTSNGLTVCGSVSMTQGQAPVLGATEAYDGFGGTLATGDFNGDGYADLAVGVPKENVGSLSDAGCVQTFYGSACGLDRCSGAIWTQDSVGVHGSDEVGDRFGAALAAGDFDGDGIDDLAIGIPGEERLPAMVPDIGIVCVLRGDLCGLSGQSEVWYIGGTYNGYERFGSSLGSMDLNGDGCDDLCIGEPGRDIGPSNVGCVSLRYGKQGDGLRIENRAELTQGWNYVQYDGVTRSFYIPGMAEIGDEVGTVSSK